MSEKKMDMRLVSKGVSNKTKSIWYHTKKTKVPCISKEQCEVLLQENQSKDSRINYLKTKADQTTEELEKQKKEIEYLKSLLQKNDELKEKLNCVEEKVDNVKETVEEKDNQFICNQNFNQLNQNYYNVS